MILQYIYIYTLYIHIIIVISNVLLSLFLTLFLHIYIYSNISRSFIIPGGVISQGELRESGCAVSLHSPLGKCARTLLGKPS